MSEFQKQLDALRRARTDNTTDTINGMSRKDENEKAMELIVGKMKPSGTYNEVMADYIVAIASSLADISKSLAIVADALNERKAERVGHWIPIGDGSLHTCSVCGEKSCCKGNYCTDCGARMVSEDDT